MTSPTPPAPLPADERDILGAAFDRVIPADDFPSATAAGVLDYLDRHWRGDLAAEAALLADGARALEREVRARFGDAARFAALPAAEQDGVLEDVERGRVRAEWSVAPASFLRALVRVCAEGYYGDPGNGGNRDGASWRMVGFEPGPASGALPSRPLRAASLEEVDDAYDAVVVGAGAGGGVAACVLAEAGVRVLVLERGRLLDFAEIGRDHLRNHRLGVRGHSTGPDLDGHPRVLVDSAGRERVARPHEPAWHNNAMCVGGGTRVYGAQCWRFFPEDFRMAGLYGRPDGSSLADWPISYDELAPYYERAEQEIGVSDASGHTPAPPRARGWPLPPAPDNPARAVLARGARALGWTTAPVPLAINTLPRDGRAACVQCGTCVGFACPSDAKNGTHNTTLPRALATGRATLLAGAQALRIETDAHGRATSVAFVVASPRGDVQRRVRAGAVVVAAGAIESARLLLASASSSHPAGPGNAGGQLGRHLQGHVYAGAYAEFDAEVQDSRGPGPSIATCRFNHGNAGLVGGGMLANDFVMMPLHHWFAAWPPGVRRWGLDAKRRMARGYRRTLLLMGPTHEIPSPHARVELDPRVRDRFGMPVARLSGGVHPETLRTAAFLRARAEEWLRASGARDVRGFVGGAKGVLSAGQHQAGTCRMGDDPAQSVTDRFGRVHGCPNLFVADTSLHVTNGGVNPVLTAFALAYRTAEEVVHHMG